MNKFRRHALLGDGNPDHRVLQKKGSSESDSILLFSLNHGDSAGKFFFMLNVKEAIRSCVQSRKLLRSQYATIRALSKTVAKT
jgi:hypothetical protein